MSRKLSRREFRAVIAGGALALFAGKAAAQESVEVTAYVREWEDFYGIEYVAVIEFALESEEDAGLVLSKLGEATRDWLAGRDGVFDVAEQELNELDLKRYGFERGARLVCEGGGPAPDVTVLTGQVAERAFWALFESYVIAVGVLPIPVVDLFKEAVDVGLRDAESPGNGLHEHAGGVERPAYRFTGPDFDFDDLLEVHRW